MEAPKHPHESKRLLALEALNILDTPPEEHYDQLVQLAAAICDVPIAIITLVDESRQWFKAKVGIDADETSREVAFCAHCILQDSIMEIPDASKDDRFKNNALVTGDPKIRFYAGAPLYSSEKLPLGSLCVIDQKPRELTTAQKQALTTLANQVSSQMELRLAHKNLAASHLELNKAHNSLKSLFQVIAHDLRTPFNGLLGLTELLEQSYESFTTDDVRSILSTLNESASETYIMLENLLEWSNLETGSLPFHPETIYASDLVNDAVRILATSIRKKQITLTIDIPKETIVKVDASMIGSVLRNLTSNAIKFTPNGGAISIIAEPEVGFLKITITDNGIGMTKAQTDGLSLDIQKPSSIGTQGERGSGIGLTLIHNFLKKHDSHLEADSEIGRGSSLSFKVLLA